MRRGTFLLLAGALLAVGLYRANQLGLMPSWPGSKPAKYTPATAAPLERADVPRLAGTDEEYAKLVDAVMPSVVSITSQRVTNQGSTRATPFELLFGNRVGNQPVETSLGSGVIVSKEGHIITNNHVVEGMNEIEVQLFDDRSVRATVLGSDPAVDIAVLKINAPNVIPLPLGDSETVRVGQLVFAIGNPFGLGGTVTTGIISAKGRRAAEDSAVEYLQTDAAVNRGNSGGPLINLRGEIVGINTAIFSNSDEGAWLGISFAVPSNLVRRSLESLIKRGRIVRTYLGVVIADLTPQLARQFGMDSPKGSFITEVAGESPAERGGLQAGDVVLAVNGRAVADSVSLRNRLNETEVGEKVELKITRAGSERTVTVEMAEAPSELNDPAPRVRPRP
ncbi:MAG TPA: trypsin-like peptidase domain-containing protein [Chthoniobacteraceae bacterium]|nr:trypsin-like peptidase domain-containing protein [Chthoniobacteraceae bacterium]